jgi:PAS domain S-box-containing protein
VNVARHLKPWLVPLAAVLAVAVFFADLWLPLGVAGGVPYVLLVFLGWSFPKRGAIFVLAGTATVLTAVGYLYSPQGGIPWMVMANRGLALLAIWGTAIPLALAKKTQESMQESGERYRKLYHDTPTMLHSLDAEGRLVGVSDYWLGVMGYERGEVIGRKIVEFLSEESRRRALETVLPALMETGRIADVPYQFVKKNGEVIDVLLSAAMEMDEAGKPFRSLSVVTDVTERKRAEEALRKAHDDLELRVFERTRELTGTLSELRQTESALRESEERMRLMADNLPALVVSLDKDHRYRFANRAYRDWFGKDPEKIIGLHAREVLGKHVHDQTRAARDVVLGGETVRFDGSRPDASGRLRHWDATYIPEHGQSGEVTGYFALVHDITERKRAEKALRESEERFRSGFQYASAGMAMIDRKGCYISVNPTLCGMLGYTEDELLRVDRIDIIHPEDKKVAARDFRRLWEGEVESVRTVRRFRRKDGETLWGEMSISMVRDADDQPLYAFGQIQDVTDRKRIEEALRDSEEQMRVITDSVPAFIGYIDSTHRYRFVNKHYGHLHGAKPEEIVGKHVSEVIGEELYKKILPYRSAVLEGEVVTFENEVVDTQGNLIYQDATYIPHFDDSGSVIGFFALIIDITERKRTEEERRREQRLTALGNMAGGIAHNLNNLLLPIQALSEMALEEFPKASPLREDMRRVVRSSKSAKELVGRILQFGRGDWLVRQNINVCATVGDALDLLPTIVPPTVKPHIHLDPDTGMVFGDADQIQTVVMNLILNAVDAMEGRTGELEISLSAVDVGDTDVEAGSRLKAGRYARLSVADNGRGMDTEILEHVFEPFFTTKDIGEGSGLGLSSAYGIITQHGGSIRVASTPGEGSRFRVYLPLSEPRALH